MKCLRDFAIFAFDSAANRVMIFEQALVCDLTMFPGRTDGWMDLKRRTPGQSEDRDRLDREVLPARSN